MTAQLGNNDCHAELLLREKNLEGRNFRHAIVHRNAGKKLIILEINMIINGVFENMYIVYLRMGQVDFFKNYIF